MPRPLALSLSLPTLALAATAGAEGPFLVALGDPDGIEVSIVDGPIGLSADGAVVAGFGAGPNGLEAFRWSEEEGIVLLGDLPGGNFTSAAYGVSPDGGTIVGSATPGSGTSEAVFWANDVLTSIGDLPGGPTIANAYGASEGGGTIVGSSWSAAGARAFRWTAQTGMTALPLPDSQTSGPAEAFAVTPDGAVIVGRSNGWGIGTLAARWNGDAITMLGTIPGGTQSSVAYAVTPDGAVIVGGSDSAATGGLEHEPFRWTEADGMVGLGDLPGGSYGGEAYGVTADGAIVVGMSHSDHPNGRAFIWDAEHGMRNLADVLADDYGLDLSGWNLGSAEAISHDGRTIVGIGSSVNEPGISNLWMARLAAPCPADVAGDDATVDVIDLVAVLTAWGACPEPCPACAADTNGDCFVDVLDLLEVILAWGPCE